MSQLAIIFLLVGAHCIAIEIMLARRECAEKRADYRRRLGELKG